MMEGMPGGNLGKRARKGFVAMVKLIY